MPTTFVNCRLPRVPLPPPQHECIPPLSLLMTSDLKFRIPKAEELTNNFAFVANLLTFVPIDTTLHDFVCGSVMTAAEKYPDLCAYKIPLCAARDNNIMALYYLLSLVWFEI